MNCTALRKTRDLLGGDTFPRCESRSLRLEKFVRLGDNTKKEEIDSVVMTSAARIPCVLPAKSVSLVARLEGRLIVNQAGGVLENAGLCLHPHFGDPYVPGSAVKGAARHAAWTAWHEAEEGGGKDATAQEVAEIFGYPTGDSDLDGYLAERGWRDRRQSGSVGFLPAVPVEDARLVTDIVNCHHPKYYAGDERNRDAVDNESPNPQFFPAVREGAAFAFVLVPVAGRENKTERALHWLAEALETNGIGAKTASGYGWFRVNKDAQTAWQKRMEGDRARRDAEIRWRMFEKELSDLEAIYPSDAVLEPGAAADDLKAKLRKLKDELSEFSQERQNRALPRLNRLFKLLPQVSPFDVALSEWQSKSAAECAIHRFIEEFDNDSIMTPEMRKRLVALFRDSNGVGAKIWGFLKDDASIAKLKKKHIDKVRHGVLEIRKFAKTMPEGKLK